MKKYLQFLLLIFIFLGSCASQSSDPNTKPDTPKNIILLIGDGMGVSYVSTSVLSMKNDPFRRFNTCGFSVTPSKDHIVTESSAAATAIATGYRTNSLMISVHPETEKPMLTLLELAEKFNKATGIVVTSSVTHATPAAFLAHINSRYKEFEIAEQYLKRKTDVVIGGGLKFFNPLLKQIENLGYLFYNSYEELSKSKPEEKFYALLGSEGIPKAAERDYTLGDLVKKAINYLSKQSNGFVLMIEGSQIDWAGHKNDQEYILSEMEDFNAAINVALDFAEKDGETLIVITADHETGGMSITDGNLEGSNLELDFSTTHHTADMVPVFAKGPGEELFAGVYDNYMIGRKLFKFVDEGYEF